ncbi:hypothetical protein BGX34_011443 [Mortierella sp. NVP85]|nr:hypothetical protein BGX34_011443 [Mortierella sp. NVP85]
MRSNLGPQISFQLTNENLPFDPDANGALQTVATNTASAAEAGSLTATGHQFNQLFNHVNLIEEVSIPAGKTEYVILGFKPRRGKWDSTSDGMDTTNAASGNSSALGDADDIRQRDPANGLLPNSRTTNNNDFEGNDQTESFNAFEVNGAVFFFAYKIKSEDPGGSPSPSVLTDLVLSSSPPTLHEFAHDTSLPASTATTMSQDASTTNPSGVSATPSTSTLTTTAPLKADYQYTVKFRSTVCKSVLYSNIEETGISFEDCVANQEFFKDFTIWNRSEIPLYWQLHVVDAGNTSRESWLRFADYEDSVGGNQAEESVDHVNSQDQVHQSRIVRSKPIPSYGFRRIRVTFRPTENGDFLFDLLLENLNDATNVEEATIHATVRAVSRGEDTLAISTGNTMDFGDCCAGMWARLPMTFCNTGLTPTEIHLQVEGAEVVFDLQTDAGTELPEVASDLAKDSQLLLDPDIPSSWNDSSRRSESSANTDNVDPSPPSGVQKSRLREWIDDGTQSPFGQGLLSSSPSLVDSVGIKGDRTTKESGFGIESGPSSPVTSEGFFPDNIVQINSNSEKYFAGQDLGRPSREGTEEDLESEPDTSSVQDTIALHPSIGHKKRLSLRSISFSGAQRDRELAQAQLHGPQSSGRGNQSTTRIEELFLKPGKERTVIVSYRPAPEPSIENFQAGKLLRKSFRIIASYAPWMGQGSSVPFSENPQKDRKIIQCKSRACTSFVTIEQTSLDFGDTDVGAFKSLPLKLTNQSEIPATVQLHFKSKVLHCTPSGAVTIPPKSNTELKLDIYPRKVNPDYRKQLTLFNLTNRANDQIIEVRSTNIDRHRVTFHSLFYRVLYPGGSNFLDFGTVVVGGIGLRTIAISNFTRKWLKLQVTTSLSGELAVYERAREHQDYLNHITGLLTEAQNASSTHQEGVFSLDTSSMGSRGASPTFMESGGTSNASFLDGTKPSYLKRRNDTRDQYSTTGSESSTPAVVGGSALTSSLALKAKAILFHGAASQPMGNSPAKFLDLATSQRGDVKKIKKRIPTMKELLEPTTPPKNAKFAKGTSTSHQDSTRPVRSNMTGQNHASSPVAEGGSRRPEAPSAHSTQRQQEKAPRHEASAQTSTEKNQAENSLLSERSLDSVLAALGATSAAASGSMLFSKPADEERFVKDRMKLTRELQNAITSGELTPASLVNVPPETEYQLTILFTPSSTFRDHIKGIPKKQDARIFLRLVDFDRETVANNPQFRHLLDNDLGQIPLREIMVRSSLVRSIMDLGQNNINFGTMDKSEKRTKTIVLHNRSKEPLLYHIRKSGSIASGDIVLGNGKSGVVRGYSKKEVDFIFEPSLSGLYHEKLAIENVQDPESSRILSIKANIRKPKHFSIDCQEVDFGPCCVDIKTASKRITVTNSTKQPRTFEVRVDHHEMMPLSTESYHYGGSIEFTIEDDPAGQAVVTKEMEDEIEILEQKLKIAKRKGRQDKVLKVTARLSLLRKGGVEDKTEQSKLTDMDDATPTQEKIFQFSKAEQTNSPVPDTPTKSSAVQIPTSATPTTTAITKDTPKFRRTDHSIVFTLEGGKSKSVSAYFTALCDQESVPPGLHDKDRLRLQGKIYVHEHKNRDICREVSFFATVECKAHPNGGIKNVDNEQDAWTVNSTKTPVGTVTQNDSSTASDQDLRKKTTLERSVTNTPIKEPEPPAEHLALSPKNFDGGKIEHDQKGTFYFTLSNSSEDPLPFRIDLGNKVDGHSRFVFKDNEMEGSLGPKETRRITFGYSASDLGRLHDTLRVVNTITLTSLEYTFTCYAHRAQYLAFPSMDESMTLDLGYCYVDAGRKFSQVTPLLVENVTDDDVYIACASNLSQQVGIYLDEQAEKGHVSRTLLKKRSMVTVWVAVQPNLLGGIAGSNTNRRAATTSSKDRDSECRTMAGGIKFTISLPDDPLIASEAKSEDLESLTQVLSQTVKFTSIIGRSILAVSDTVLNLGWTPDVGKPVYGSFTLHNLSSLLPLDFHVESLSGNIMLNRTRGVLDGWDVDRSSQATRSKHDTTHDQTDYDLGEVAPTDRSRLLISFRVSTTTPGLLTDTILVTNENNCSQKIEVKVRLFVDPKNLQTTLHGQGYACPLTAEDLCEMQHVKPGAPREGLSLPSLSWDDVYVNVHEEQDKEGQESHPHVLFQPAYGETEAHAEERWIELINHNSEPMELVPLCDVAAEAIWECVEPSVDDQVLPELDIQAIDGFHFCGPVIRVAPAQKVRLLVSCPEPDLCASSIESLQNGKSVPLNGNLMVLDRLHNQIVKVLGLCATFGISYGTIVPLSTDLGKIGHYNSWDPVKVDFEVKNESDIPLVYEIIVQSYMDLVPSESMACLEDQTDGHSSLQTVGTKRTVQGQSVGHIEIMLDPKKIENFEPGRRTFPIRMVNLNNPKNEASHSVSALLTEFELGFDRLKDGILLLPPLTHPLPSSALPCDTWFSITNKSAEDVRFEIGATLSPDVMDYVHLDVLSRFSNSPLRGTISLGPKGSIEVRIRAFPKEGSRLPSDTTALCTSQGLLFGSLWVATKTSSSEDDSLPRKYAESISIRGSIVEGPMFSLSTQRIVFRSLLETSDTENESDDENLSAKELPLHSPSKDVPEDDAGPGPGSNVQRASIVVSNLSMHFPLDFCVTLEGPMEYPAAEIIQVTPLDANNSGTVEAGQQLKLVVELVDPRVIISEDIKLHIRNLNSNQGQQRSVVISIVSDRREHRKPNKKHITEDERIDPHHRQNKVEEPPLTKASGGNQLSQSSTLSDVDTSLLHPIISLRGCKRIDSGDPAGGRYELDLGQQDMGSPNVLRKIVLENTNYDRVSYRIRTITALDKNWLKISRLEGTLEPPADEPMSSTSTCVHTITLSFSTNVRNVFSTYLLVENLDNPADTKTVRVTMEVVARQNLRRATKANDPNNRVFDVFVNGLDFSSSLIEMKNLYYGSEYTARSMVVYNRESVPMEFTASLNPQTHSTEILFSTSRTSAKLFKTLTVPSENYARVYLRFFPKPSPAIQAALDNGEYRDPDEMELKTVEIYINCRLVKDYQQVITLTAECYLPAIRVDWEDSVSFIARVSRDSSDSDENADEWKITFKEDYRALGVSNLLNIPLDYEIVNDTMYFHLEFPEPDKMIEGHQRHEVRVLPNMKALLRNAENFRRERYVQENITIYNRNRPLENYWIPLRISFGNVSNFQLSSGYKSSYAFGMIEQHVVNFLSDFNTHAVMVTTGSSCLPSSSSSSSINSNSNSTVGMGGSGPGNGFGSGFNLASVGFGLDRGAPLANNLIHPSSSPTMLMNGGLALLAPSSLGPVVGMLGLGRTTSALAGHHSPSHHPHQSSPEAQENQRKLIDLEFQYRYVVDQLVYYSTIKTSENFFQLASLLFCTLLSNRIFQIWSPAYLRDPRKSPSHPSQTLSGSNQGSGSNTHPGPGSGSGPGSGASAGSNGGGAAGAGGIEYDESGDRISAQTSLNGSTQQRTADESQIRVWPEPLRKWVEALDYFVSFFPFHTRQLETLKALHHSLISS